MQVTVSDLPEDKLRPGGNLPLELRVAHANMLYMIRQRKAGLAVLVGVEFYGAVCIAQVLAGQALLHSRPHVLFARVTTQAKQAKHAS